MSNDRLPPRTRQRARDASLRRALEATCAVVASPLPLAERALASLERSAEDAVDRAIECDRRGASHEAVTAMLDRAVATARYAQRQSAHVARLRAQRDAVTAAALAGLTESNGRGTLN